MVLVGTMVSENGGQKQRELEEDPNVCKERGNEEFKNGFWDEALVWYTKAIKNGEKHKDLPVFYKNRAATYLKLENYSKALDDCTKSLEGCPNDPKALFRRFQALEGLERFEESYRDLRAIHTQDPNNKTIKPHLERMHAIVQERSRQRAQTSNKVTQMFQIAFDLAAAKEKREQAMNNIVVLARETAGAEVMMKEIKQGSKKYEIACANHALQISRRMKTGQKRWPDQGVSCQNHRNTHEHISSDYFDSL